jgi:hypothetical protein
LEQVVQAEQVQLQVHSIITVLLELHLMEDFFLLMVGQVALPLLTEVRKPMAVLAVQAVAVALMVVLVRHKE